MYHELMNLALSVAQFSPCKRDQVGCVVRNQFGILFSGFNYHPSEICELENGKTKPDTIHAEMMTLGLNDDWINSELFVTRRPCIHCAEKILKARVAKVTYLAKGNTYGIELLEQYKDQITLFEMPLTEVEQI